MSDSLFDEKDLTDMRERGIALEEILKQIDIFKKSFSFEHLLRTCRIGDGIKRLDDKDIPALTSLYDKAQVTGRAMKFIPASGAASRMFKELITINSQLESADKDTLSELSINNEDYKYFLTFIENIKKIPFYNDLKSSMKHAGIDIDEAIAENRFKDILLFAITEKGLNLSALPKALIPFHQYPGSSRTPIEEHIAESGTYTSDKDGKVRIHFTVSPEHEEAIIQHVNSIIGHYDKSGLHHEISFSNQKPSTDTIAVDMDNNPFREADGRLVFRQGGHGALIENLGDLKGDIIFIKTIDNVTPDRLKNISYRYKKALGGHLVELQGKIFSYLEMLESGDRDETLLNKIFDFIRDDLSVAPPDGMMNQSLDKRIGYLVSRLNRPLRVCGMVKNQGEPGGGPYWVGLSDGSASPQIVEKSQINMDSEEQRNIFKSSTHFNPVDLVCGVRDYKGASFDLKKYVDPETCFISIKSKDGRELKALELPGLWNGAMSYWNTVFIEVPLITFNPVKTIFDLLRKEHQPEVTIK